jgi:hypothetical protein
MNEIIRLIPSPQSRIISEDEVSLARLQSVLEAAVFDVKMDSDGDLYVTDGLDFPSWISLLDDAKMIAFLTYIKPDYSDVDYWLARMNEINHTTSLVQFHWCGNAIWGHYAMSYENGLNVRQFVKVLRRFSSTFSQGALMACDDESDEANGEDERPADPDPQWQTGDASNIVLFPGVNRATAARNATVPRAQNVIIRFITVVREQLRRLHFNELTPLVAIETITSKTGIASPGRGFDRV